MSKFKIGCFVDLELNFKVYFEYIKKDFDFSYHQRINKKTILKYQKLNRVFEIIEKDHVIFIKINVMSQSLCDFLINIMNNDILCETIILPLQGIYGDSVYFFNILKNPLVNNKGIIFFEKIFIFFF